MSNATTPGSLLSFPIPNIKSVIMAVLRPELKAVANIHEEEILYMRNSINTQNTLLLKIQGYFAEQSSQLVDRIMKDLELALSIHKLQVQKVDRTEHNSLVDSVSSHNQILMQIQMMLASQNSSDVDRIMKELSLSLDIVKLKTQKVDRIAHNQLVDNVAVLGRTLSTYVEIVDGLSKLVSEMDMSGVEELTLRLNNVQQLIYNLESSTDLRTSALEVMYQELQTELAAIKEIIDGTTGG